MTRVFTHRTLSSSRSLTPARDYRCNNTPPMDQNIHHIASINSSHQCPHPQSCTLAHQADLPNNAGPGHMKQEVGADDHLPRRTLLPYSFNRSSVSDSTGTAIEGDQHNATLHKKSRVLAPGKVKKEKWIARSPRQGVARLAPSLDEGNKAGSNVMDGESDDEASEDSCENNVASRTQKGILACPFYKHDSVRYLSCVRLRLTRVRDVKQHLKRRHRQPLHCPVCGKVFGETQDCMDHMMSRTCVTPPGGFVIEGLTPQQKKELGHRVNRSLKESEQWYSIWRILFPGSPKPASPWVRNNLEETLGMIQDYWSCHGHRLVTQLLKYEYNDCSHPDFVAAVSTHAVETLLHRFQTSSQLAMDPTSANPTIIRTVGRSAVRHEPEATAPLRLHGDVTLPHTQSIKRHLNSLRHEPCPTTGICASDSYLLERNELCNSRESSQSQNLIRETTLTAASDPGLNLLSLEPTEEALYTSQQTSNHVFSNDLCESVPYDQSIQEGLWPPLDHLSSSDPRLIGAGTWCDEGIYLGLPMNISTKDQCIDHYMRNATEYEVGEADMLVESEVFLPNAS